MIQRLDHINAPAMHDDDVPNFHGLEVDPSGGHGPAT